tara:strand:+ start:21118 stop:22980 length:1863 start_codon:yes stop_codon:yes gene_type:complete
MALIKKGYQAHKFPVIESPHAGSTMIYLYHQPHDKNTLAPIMANEALTQQQHDYPQMAYGNVNMHPAGTGYSGFNIVNNNETSISASTFRAGGGFTVMLPKMTAGTSYGAVVGGHNDSYWSNVDPCPFMSMDETIENARMRRIVDGDNELVVMLGNEGWSSNYHCNVSWYNKGSTYNLHDSPPSNDEYLYSHSSTYYQFPYMATVKVGNYVSSIYAYYRYSYAYQYVKIGRNSFSNYHSDTRETIAASQRNYYTLQYIGTASDGNPLYLYNFSTNDHQQYVTKHNVAGNTITDLHNFTAAPSATGTSAGGTRATSAFETISKMASHVFDDPASSGNKAFYVPYFDTSMNYHPWCFKWNTSADSFTRDQCSTITGTLSSGMLNNMDGTTTYRARLKGLAINETFVNSGNRYLTVFPLQGQKDVTTSTPTKRTFVTYAVSGSDATALTYHSNVISSTQIYQIIWLNDTRTKLGTFSENAFKIYNWNNTDGWVLTSTINESFNAVGRDSTDRIWAVGGTRDDVPVDIHLLSNATPVRVAVTPADSTYNYAGSNINSTVGVSAYNMDGARMAVSVNLTIQGSTMTFSGGATTATVTTSTSADVDEAIIITGSGTSDILTNVQLS